MVLCLFIGFLLAAGMMSTVPIYMDSSLQRILIKDMQAYQQETGEYPGEYVVTKSVPIKADNAQRRSAVQEMTELVDDRTSRIDRQIKRSSSMMITCTSPQARPPASRS